MLSQIPNILSRVKIFDIARIPAFALMRFRSVSIMLVLLGALNMWLIQGPGSDLFAFEKPINLFDAPVLSVLNNSTAGSEYVIPKTRFEILAEKYIESRLSGDSTRLPSPVPDSLNDTRQFLSLSMGDFTTYSTRPSAINLEGFEIKNKTPSDAKADPEDAFNPIILEAANRYCVEPAIIKAIIKAESGYNPKAVSHRGARGLMQLMPRTAKSLGVEDSFCPVENINGGVKYFKQLLVKYKGNTKLALAAYNAGSRNVKKYKGVPPFKTTKLYIKKIFKYQREYKKKMIENG